MRIPLVIFSLPFILAFYSCESKKAELKWTSNSIFAGDRNIVIDFPNVVKIKSDEYNCKYDPFRTYINFVSVVDKDTIKMNTSFIHFDIRYFQGGREANSDSIKLENIIDYLREQKPTMKVTLKSRVKKNGVKFLIVRYNYNGTKNCRFNIYPHRGEVLVDILNLSDENIYKKLTSSIKYEDKERHICW